MPLQKAEARFDFKPTAPVELELKKGDIVVVRRTSVGEGWWEGEINGRRGLFPSSFVKMLPASAGGSPVRERPPAPATPVSSKKVFMDTLLTPSVNTQEQLYDRERASDLFVRGHSDVSISAGPRWNCFPPTLTIFIKNLHTESRFSGVKHFTVFDVETKQLGTVVTRRYKNFLWFYDKMAELFPCISLPPLPVKQFSGSLLEEHGVEARRRGLETFLNKVASHPVLGSTRLLHDFLTEKEQTKDWKIGRHISNLKLPKSAKKLFHAPVYSTVKYPPFNVPINQLPSIEKFLKFSRLMEAQIQNLQNSCQLLCLSSGEMMSRVNQLGKDFQRMARGAQPIISLVRRKVTPTHSNNLGLQNGQSHHPGPITRQASGDVVEDEDTDGEMDENVQWNWRDDAKFNCFMREIYDVATGMRKLATIQKDHQDSVEEDVIERLSDYISTIHTLPTLVKLHEEAMEAYNTSKDKDTKKEAEEVRQHCETINNIILAEFDHFSETMVKDFETIILNLLKEQATFHRHVAKSWDSLYEGYANRRASSLPQIDRITSSGKSFSFDRSGSFRGSFTSNSESSQECDPQIEMAYDPMAFSGTETHSDTPSRSDLDVTPQPPKPSTSSGIIPTYINVERLNPTKQDRDSWDRSGSEQDTEEHNELYESVIVHDDYVPPEADNSRDESHSYANLEIIKKVPAAKTKSAPNSPKKPKKPIPIKRKQGSDANSLTSSLEITNSSESNSSPVLKPKKPQPPAKPKRSAADYPSLDKPNLSVSTPMLNQIVQQTSPDTAKFLAPRLSPPQERRPRNRSKTECDPAIKKRPMLPPMKISLDQAVKKPTPFKMPSKQQTEEKESPERKTSAHPPLKPLPSDPGTFRNKVMSMHEASSQGGRSELMRKLSLRRQRLDEQLGPHKVPKHKPHVDKIKEAGSERNSSISTGSSDVVVKYSSHSTPDGSNGSQGDGVVMRTHDESLAKYGIIEDTEGGSFII